MAEAIKLMLQVFHQLDSYFSISATSARAGLALSLFPVLPIAPTTTTSAAPPTIFRSPLGDQKAAAALAGSSVNVQAASSGYDCRDYHSAGGCQRALCRFQHDPATKSPSYRPTDRYERRDNGFQSLTAASRSSRQPSADELERLKSVPCLNYKDGFCRYGDRCYRKHE